jgi:HD-like signal output (HDOD) protein
MTLPASVLDPVLKSKLQIPPRPQVVCVLQEEVRKEMPDLARIGRAISGDVGLAGAILRIANSPAFGLSRKVTAIPQAIAVLGLKNSASLATALALRGSFGAQTSMERFWDTAEKVALLCSVLAQRLRGIKSDEAYTVGLFHDCGIPILMQHKPNYKQTLARANHADNRSFVEIETEEVGTSHCAVGYFLARSWELPDALCQTILWHHDTEVFSDPAIPDVVRNYVGIIHLAQHVQHLMVRSSMDFEWRKFAEPVLAHFGLTEEDFINLMDDAQDVLLDA